MTGFRDTRAFCITLVWSRDAALELLPESSHLEKIHISLLSSFELYVDSNPRSAARFHFREETIEYHQTNMR